MNKPLLALLALCAAAGASAQVVEVAGLHEVKVPGLAVNMAKVSPDGSFAIVSDQSGTALYRVDMATGSSAKVADNGSLQSLAFAPDCSSIVYKASTASADKRRYYSVNTLDLASGATRRMSRPARHCADFTVSSSGMLTMAGESALHRSVSVAGRAAAQQPTAVVSIYRGHLQVTLPDGSSSFIDPQGHGSYLWPSLSPDGTKIVYYKSQDGCYVCNLDGSNARAIGYLHAPVWLGNDAVIGCQDIDNGRTVTSSSIVAAKLDGTMQTLTDGALLGMCPSVSSDAKTVSFTTADGHLYVLTLK